MKKIILSAIAVISIAGSAQAAQTITEALEEGKFKIDARVFYFDRSFDTDGLDNATALTAGGIMKYESANYNGLKMGLGYYGSNRVSGMYTKVDGTGTSLLTSDGENLNFLGEAYLEYTLSNTMIKAGRQQLSTPLIQGHDLRLLPSVYEAVIVKNKDIADTTVELGYVLAYTGFTSKYGEFLDTNAKWGDKGLAYISLVNNSYKPLTLKAQYVKALSDTKKDSTDKIARADYRYTDFKYSVPVGEKTYVKAQYGGNDYVTGVNSKLVGAKIGTTVSIVDLAILYDKISGNTFQAVESGPMYSDWQQGYGNYEPSTAVGGQVVLKPMDVLSLKVGYVDVAAANGYVRDDFSEMNIDAKYKINKISKLRVRYSVKDQTDTSDREDRNDFRIIYYASF